MALPPSECDKRGGTEALIREISQGGVRRSGSIRADQHLMLLAGDPLLMGQYLQRQNAPAPKVMTAVPVSGETTIAIARSILAHGTLEHQVTESPKRFLQHETLLEPSLVPSKFSPSGEDREAAFDLDQTPKDEETGATGHQKPAMIFSGMFLVVSLLLLWAFAPD